VTNSSHPKVLLLIVGMHRSGTSAVCAALAASGVSFGAQLIDPMAGVNDEGFWENASVVALNEQLLALTQSTWFAPVANIANTDWESSVYDSLREQAASILKNGFGASSPQAVKDPRFCLTLPFWLACCEKLGISVGVCAVSRAPMEVAQSLERRDGFPLGYSLRLCLLYRACMQKFLPPAETFHVRYDDLLRDASSVIGNLAAKFQLTNLNREVATAVRVELRHQFADADPARDWLGPTDCAEPDLEGLALDIDARYPVESTLRDFARRFTARGVELERIGQAHTLALATINERDQQIGQLGDEHSYALQVLRERDAEIARLNQRRDWLLALPGVRQLRKLMKFVLGKDSQA
jgi:hypothetical protein